MKYSRNPLSMPKPDLRNTSVNSLSAFRECYICLPHSLNYCFSDWLAAIGPILRQRLIYSIFRWQFNLQPLVLNSTSAFRMQKFRREMSADLFWCLIHILCFITFPSPLVFARHIFRDLRFTSRGFVQNVLPLYLGIGRV